MAIAEEVKAEGLHPIFVMDSYRALLAASGIEIEENSSRYANPLRQLKKALARPAPPWCCSTTAASTSSKRAVAESNSRQCCVQQRARSNPQPEVAWPMLVPMAAAGSPW